jgi:DNA-binding CsgD family transcriptional regulator
VSLVPRLSPREREIWALHQDGLSPAEIGLRLLISEFTVNVFLRNIRLKQASPYPPSVDEE